MTNFDVCFVSSEEAMVASKEFITSVVVGKYSQYMPRLRLPSEYQSLYSKPEQARQNFLQT